MLKRYLDTLKGKTNNRMRSEARKGNLSIVNLKTLQGLNMAKFDKELLP